MKLLTWQVLLEVILVLVSAVFYLVQINVFGLVEDAFFHMFPSTPMRGWKWDDEPKCPNPPST